jgi:hypothetical protein
MKEQEGTVWNNVLNTQITQADPHAFFYNLFCCSASRFCENGYISGCYLFTDTWGLEVLGSAKTGSMLYFEDYYCWIQQGECQGEAFRRWFALHGEEPGSVMWAMSWFYGMTELGDPTLFMKVGVQVSQVQVIDDGTGASDGDGDGIPDAGESVLLNLTLQNNDPIPHNDLWVKLSSSATGVNVFVDCVYVASLPALGTAQANGFLTFIDHSVEDSTVFSISVQIHDDSLHLWGDTFNLTVRNQKPVLVGYELTQISGDGDSWADPGETFNVTCTFTNQGGHTCRNGVLTFLELYQWVIPDTTGISFPQILPGQTVTLASSFPVHILPGCPTPHGEIFQMAVFQGDIGFSDHFIFPVGDQLIWADSIPDPDYALTHYPVTQGYEDQWHVNPLRSFSPPNAMKFGSGITPYAPQSDGVLETPLFALGNNTELRFNHWIAAEEGYDGGVVEINTGSGWQRLTPEGGYPGNSQGNGSYPGGPCYNGEMDWSPAVFDLSGHEGFARLRFRFASDGGVELEGWYVDDITLEGDLFLSAPEGPTAPQPYEFSLEQNRPNPFNPITVIRYQIPDARNVNMKVYDTAGRLIATLVDGRQQAGTHQAVFDGSRLASGLYFVKLQAAEGPFGAGDYTAVRKMMLVK